MMARRRVHDLPDIEHGTVRGASMHRRRKEVACKPCHQAENTRKSGYTAARNAALADLAAMYPTDFRALLTKHKVARGLVVKEVKKIMTLTETEKSKIRVKAWQAAVKRLIEAHREEFQKLYAEEKAERGL